jgi:dihydrofolate synthase / folylpolyglutamate synthase
MDPESPAPPDLPQADGGFGRLFPPLPASVHWGLDRVRRILSKVGNPQDAVPALVVGGTNGKGSVAAVWDEVLSAAGFRTGRFSSPHLRSVSERIRVEGEPLPMEILEPLAQEIRSPLVRDQPSIFEATTVLAFLAFQRLQVDLAILEVGMGGRLDPVNVVTPILTAVTNVGLDHQAFLGSTVAEIAREKAGIFRPGVPAFTGAIRHEAYQVLAEEAAALGIPLGWVRRPPGQSTLEGAHPGTSLTLDTRIWGRLDLHTPLLGGHQRSNVALAVRALEALPPRFLPSRRAVVEGVAQTRLEGRLQFVSDGPRLAVFDVAHNLDGVQALVDAVGELRPPRPRVAVVGMLADKPALPILKLLGPAVDRLVLTLPPGAPFGRAWDPAELAEAPLGAPVEIEPDLNRALDRARALLPDSGTLLVTGSFYTVGAALAQYERLGVDVGLTHRAIHPGGMP